MRIGKTVKLHILLLAVCLLLIAFPVFAENEEPLTLTVEADPDCLLSEAGDMTYFWFRVKNNLDEEYVLENMTLQGDILTAPMLISDRITIKANDVLSWTVENVRIEDFMFDMDLTFQLTWNTTTYAPEDVEQQEPIVTEHAISAPIRIERFVEPVMDLSASPDVLLARKGDTITITYTLINDTKFDMTNITLQDAGIPQLVVSLPKAYLNAGERMEATASIKMEDNTLELNPTVQYTVRGSEAQASASDVITVEHVDVDLQMEINQYPATAEGTLFRINLINNGTHPMTDIRIVDEIGTVIAEGIPLDAGKEKFLSCTVPSATSSGTVRYISFEVTGKDCMGNLVKVARSDPYEVLPFVDSDQVRLKLSVFLTNSAQSDDGSNRLKVLFEINNDSRVPISHAVISEGDYFKSVVNEYDSLSIGTTSFEKEFVAPAETRSLTFVLTALDPAGTQYATTPMTLDLSPLMAPKPTNPPAIKPGKTVDVTGTIYDTERYIRLFRLAALIVLALTMVFLLLAAILRVAEVNVRRLLPKEPMARPFGPRKTATGPIPVKDGDDPVHDMFGYMQPAKLRYMDRTDRFPTIAQEQTSPAPRQTGPVSINTFSGMFPPVSGDTNASRREGNTNASRREGEITAVPIHKRPARPVMMSTDDTMPFAPVHVGQDEATAASQEQVEPAMTQDEPVSGRPRVMEIKPVPRKIPRQKLQIIHVTQP